MELQLENLTKQYASQIAVNNINATLTCGVYGLLGANGAGKTTLMRLICDIQSPTLGTVCYNGLNIQEAGERYRNILGYLPQDFGYYPGFTAYSFLMYMSAIKGLSKAFAKERSLELLDEVGLLQVKDKKIKTFSGGMKQRLGIAQAMLNDPKILILDEPTAGLDPKERVRFRNLISTFSQNKIVLLSTHIVSDVEYIAGQILIMKKGKFILEGKPNEIIQKIAGNVWECQVPNGEVSILKERHIISNLRPEGNMTVLRMIDENKPMETAKSVTPNLEDLYLYYFHEPG
ncbi:MAG: ABC transporter ATP-binding protein [Lachnospiraceae bacterium]|nr:ABC transporter ATP-binding protein [Lachnospiraceae bacterium]